MLLLSFFLFRLEADPKPSPVAATIPSQKPVAPAPVQQSKPMGPSKVMASAAVRLYKINQSTRAYEPVENSAMLGCAILGTGLNFQILVYNAQVTYYVFSLIVTCFISY